MMKLIMLGFLFFLSGTGFAKSDVSVFVSFSMPKPLLTAVLEESVRLNIPVYLNGFIDDSMEETVKASMALTQAIPGLNLQIDPTKLEDYAITKVPAVVVANHHQFDVIYGHLSIKDSLNRLTNANDSGFNRDEFKELTHA